jgi:hypothetical protein
VIGMKLDIRALALATGVLWGAAMLLMTAANGIWPGYGRAFLDVMASVYPGFRPGGSIGSIVTGTLYGLVDGGIGGAVFGWLYNCGRPRA